MSLHGSSSFRKAASLGVRFEEGLPLSSLSSEFGDLENPECPVAPVAVDFPAEQVGQWHHHQRLQLLYAASGVLHVATHFGAWMVAPQQAIWMPPLVAHQVCSKNAVAIRTLYIDPGALFPCNSECCVVRVSAFLQQLILRAMDAGANYRIGSPEWRLMMVILDELRSLKPEPMHLPYPSDPRLLGITEKLMANPADRRPLAKWAKCSGASERTLSRLFLDQTGMTFGQWRERLRLTRSITQLLKGDPVNTVAYDLGYKNASDFIAMFRRNMNETPCQYVKHHKDMSAVE